MYQQLLDKTKTSNTYAIAKQITAEMYGTTMHKHFHVLYDLIDTIDKNKINYAEIGIYNGGSFSMVLQHPKIINAIGIDPFQFPNQRYYADQNIKKYNIHNANVQFLDFYSAQEQCISNFGGITKRIGGIDLLFIDGDHRRSSVLSDFYNYYHYVNEGGYIVFDDYNDSKYSPDVMGAVDDLMKWIADDPKHINCTLEIIGALPNFSPEIHYPDRNVSNEYIVRVTKKHNFILNKFLKLGYPLQYLPIIDTNVEFAIVVATYPRADGSTPRYMKRCMESIDQQKYSKWKLYLVGDDYQSEEELFGYIKHLSDENKCKVVIINNDDAERKYITNKKKLWCIAGAGSMNVGLDAARKDGATHYVHLDDDDYWTPEHLLLNAYVYNEYPDCVFTVCKSTYGTQFLPYKIIHEIRPDEVLPTPGGMIHSAFSFRCDIIPTKYFTTHEEEKITDPADFMMLREINIFIRTNKMYSSIYIPWLTVHHDEEGTSILS
jgi:predicted O-methyltransferase YrrM